MRARKTALLWERFAAVDPGLMRLASAMRAVITLGPGAPVSLVALAAGAVLRPYPVTAAIVFLLLICLAVRARRYGARGRGVGVFGFMGFFLAQFAGARASELPAMGGAVVVAFCAVVVVSYGTGFLTSSCVLARLRRTLNARLRDVLRDTAVLLSTAQDTGTLSLSLERRLDRLHAAARWESPAASSPPWSWRPSRSAGPATRN